MRLPCNTHEETAWVEGISIPPFTPSNPSDFLTRVRNFQEKLDENQSNLIQKVCELIGEVRAEGIANVKQLKKAWGSARPEGETKENTAKVPVKVRELVLPFSLAPSLPLTHLEFQRG